MKPPTQAARMLRSKLQALAGRGVGGEADAARSKLARLDGRYNFAIRGEQAEGDIFAGLTFNCRSGTARHLADFACCDSDIASFVQWAISKAAGVNGSLRTGPDWRISVWMEAEAHAMPRLSVIASTIARSFADLWARFAATPGVPPAARRCFLLGLYDSMMDEARAAGQRLPPVTIKPGKVSRAKRKLALAPGVALHPYEIARELGASIRLSVPIGQIVETLGDRIEALAA